MSEETPAASEEAATEAPQEPKVRRISNRNPRKSAKTETDREPPPMDSGEAGREAEVPSEEFQQESNGGTSQGDESPKQEQKRSNRRRRGKGKSGAKDTGEARDGDRQPENGADPATEDEAGEAGNEQEKPPRREQPQPSPRPQQMQRKRPDPEKVAKNAWKIYLAEVSEEGVALIGDNDARELARRCFRLSEIFLEEEDRRH
jgi:hypothetical protein